MSSKPLLSTSDEMPSATELLERLRAEGKQPTVKVKPCLGCGELHRGIGAEDRCIRSALVAARATSELSKAERTELAELRVTNERLERQIANTSLQARGRG